jgi:hypothetical protein
LKIIPRIAKHTSAIEMISLNTNAIWYACSIAHPSFAQIRFANTPSLIPIPEGTNRTRKPVSQAKLNEIPYWITSPGKSGIIIVIDLFVERSEIPKP